MIDGKSIDFTAMKGNDCYSVFLPPGKHYAEITLGNDFSFGVNFASLWSAVVIATFGFFAVLTLIIMYMWVKLTRKNFGY